MNEKADIDSILNAFLDGELSQRQQTEVKRLIKNDENIAEKLRCLERCRQLVSSLPIETAPDGLIEHVKAKLQQRQTLPEDTFEQQRLQGQQYLFKRKLISTAAIAALAACLVIVIYTIVVPEKAVKQPITVTEPDEPAKKIAVKTAEMKLVTEKAETTGKMAVSSYKEISAKLRLTTDNFVAVDAFITRAIEDNGLLEYSIPKELSRKGVYSIRCPKANLNSLLYDLQSVWDKFDSAVLSVNDGQEGEITIEDVLPAQIAKIIEPDSGEESTRLAKDFAISNRMTKGSEQEDILTGIEPGRTDLISIPKPVLTSNDKEVKKPAEIITEQNLVTFTIVVADSE